MAKFLGKTWTKSELLSYIGDVHQVAGVRPAVLSDGKAVGVRAAHVHTGTGFNFMVVPGRGMDIPEAFYHGKALHYASGTGITSPAYYEEPGFGWLRSFFVGLLTTCGITYAGFPDEDEGEAYGLHGRVSNADAENVGINQEWRGDEYVLTLQGMVREAKVFGEYMTLTRKIETQLGRSGFTLHDVIENRGFEPQPLMMLYHFNFGYPLLGPDAKVVGPVTSVEPRDEESAKDNGIAECLEFSEPIPGYKEKVFFYTLGTDAQNRTFMALLNRDVGDGTPLGIVMRYNKKDLPKFLEWKMPGQGLYVLGLEPGTVGCLGRAKEKAKGEVPYLQGQESHSITVDFDVITTIEEMEQIESEAKALK